MTENQNNEKIKLTPKQDSVIWCLQNGWVLITDCEVKGAWVANKTSQFHINSGLFFRLYNMGLIWQDPSERYGYVLTNKGKSIKTKSYEL